MPEITAATVGKLREMTNAGLMDCKKALTEAAGDLDAAVDILRKRGVAQAAKKAGREAREGVIAQHIAPGGKLGVLAEVNCETDFVAKNENFQAFVASLVNDAKGIDGSLAEAAKDKVVAKIAEIGENLIVRRNVKYTVSGNGAVAGYIHLGGKVGVLLEVGCGKAETASAELFKETIKDVTLHIAAANPQFLNRSDVAAEVIAAEREIYAKQVEGKPANIVDKIVDGKLEKYYSQICLVEQGFVKDPDQTVADMLAARGKELGDTLTIRRFTRYQVGV